MSDQTPSLDDVRTDYAQLTARHRGSFFGNRDEFDRAIAKIRTEAKAEALRAFADEVRDFSGDTTARHIEDMARISADNLEAS